jgi:hypothetical protein
MEENDMDPVMKLTERRENGERIVELAISRANLNHLLAGCPDVDCLIGQTREGISFRLFPNPTGSMPKAFMTDSEGYSAYIGAPVEILPPNVTHEEFDRLAQKTDENLIGAIQNSGPIPMQMRTSIGTVNVGHVILKLELGK